MPSLPIYCSEHKARIGTQMNPTIKARATTAIADDKRSPVLVSRERNSGILLREELLRLTSLSESLIDTISHTTAQITRVFGQPAQKGEYVKERVEALLMAL